MWRRRGRDYEVRGTIRSIEVHEVPNKAQGKPARAETRFRLDVDAVFDGRGNRLADFPYDDFRGDGEIAREFGAGDAVKVTFAASTGRTVKSISRV